MKRWEEVALQWTFILSLWAVVILASYGVVDFTAVLV